MITSPAIPGHTEEGINHTSEWKRQIAHKEVFQIQDVASRTERSEAGQQIEAQNTWKGSDAYNENVDKCRFFSRPSGNFHTHGHEVFKHRNDGGEGGECHEQEEKASPEMSVGHRIEDIWQGDKNQAWSLVRLHPVGEAGRENNQAGNDGDEGIQ